MSIRKTTIYSLIFIFVGNAFLVLSYYKFFLVDDINKNVNQLIEKYDKDLVKIVPELESSTKEDLVNNCRKIASKNAAVITIQDSNGDIVFTNETKEDKAVYVSSKILTIDEESYIVYYYDYTDTTVSWVLIIRNFMILEVSFAFIILILGSVFANSAILSPIQRLQRDMTNYQIGIRPVKTKVKTRIDALQNNVVNIIDELEEEKVKRNRIIASISHDIKTPLTSIIGYASRLDTSVLPEETKKTYVRKIYNKSLVMKELVEEFDDYLSCNIDNTLKKEKIYIKDLFKELKNDYKEELEEKKIKFILKTDCENDFLVIDKAKMKRIFSNIITNSVNHLKNEEKVIKLTCYKKKKDYEFSIADSGEGVKKEDLKNIFEPLWTTDPSRRIPGLGLAICKEIIVIHGGEIYAENNEMGGLSIYFTIPVKDKGKM